MVTSEILHEGENVRLLRDPRGWTTLEIGGEPPRIGGEVLAAIELGLDAADRRPLVIAPIGTDFAFGADLDAELRAALTGQAEPLERALEHYQRVMSRVQRADRPVVAAVRGVAISGGCELIMHATGVVAQADSVIGLAEPTVGLVPGGGGLKEFARRAAVAASGRDDLVERIARAVETLGQGRPVRGAAEARRSGFLKPGDAIVEGGDLVAAAGRLALELAAAGHLAFVPDEPIAVAGPRGFASIDARLHKRHAAGELGDHEYEVARRVALVLCAAELERSEVSEADLFMLERRHLIALARTEETRALLLSRVQTLRGSQ